MTSAANVPPASHPRLWETKNPTIAGILAYLIPGAGHIYQGRTVKGIIYFFSILGLFIWGQRLGEGMVVYTRPNLGAKTRNVGLSYVAQLGVGAASLPALLQNERANSPENSPIKRLRSPLTAPFEGVLVHASGKPPAVLVGTIRLEPTTSDTGMDFRGTFEGTLDGEPGKLELGGTRFLLDSPVKAGFQRDLECSVLGDPAAEPRDQLQTLHGWIPRSFINAYGAPPDTAQLQLLSERLGKTYELAMVFTWIAGLLNFLAIWDCVLGPAYGFGDEPSTKGAKPATEPATAAGSSPNPPVEPPKTDAPSAQKTPV
jgi:hypothetical protein